MSEWNKKREILNYSKVINSDYQSTILYGLDMNKLIPNTLGWDTTLVDNMYKVLTSENDDNRGEYLSNLVCICAGPFNKINTYCPVYIMNWGEDVITTYQFILTAASIALNGGRNLLIGQVATNIVGYTDNKGVAEPKMFIRNGKKLLRKIEIYGSNKEISL